MNNISRIIGSDFFQAVPDNRMITYYHISFVLSRFRKNFFCNIDSEQDIFDFLSIEQVVNRRRSFGGTARENVVAAIETAEEELKQGR